MFLSKKPQNPNVRLKSGENKNFTSIENQRISREMLPGVREDPGRRDAVSGGNDHTLHVT